MYMCACPVTSVCVSVCLCVCLSIMQLIGSDRDARLAE